MKCDDCGRWVPESDITRIKEATEEMNADDWKLCPSCVVAGIASGAIDLNPDALAPIDDENEGEEWKS